MLISFAFLQAAKRISMIRVRVELYHLKFNPSHSNLNSVSDTSVYEKVGPRATGKRKFNSCSWTTQETQNCSLLIHFFQSFSQMVETSIYSCKAQFLRNLPNLLTADGCGVWWVGKSCSQSSSYLIVFLRSLKGSFYSCLRAREHWNLRSLIDGQYQDCPISDVVIHVSEHLRNACVASNPIGGLSHCHTFIYANVEI